ncbi:hypothetical protein L211DRAFT_8984 [Terfezia boudieri ATCC MYA-4762]|uniref:Uncharacterized protein n=1 Tax=Terfezia boudieri ATCC MYA-4762 TaxID=1051890 RepID=A0A3N4M2Y3_9PEZI|nr:hypothetical protein L211DRAFT_8984 [Terfezia boudieri ATCC MYA-4762]
MSTSPRRYCIDELLALRDSPLVQKPDGLPPIEEWMGPPAAQVPRAAGRGIAGQGTRDQVTRARTDGDLHANGDENGPKAMGLNRRTSMFDNRLTSRSSIPEDIILGPPKLSFASASSSRKMAFNFDTLGSAGLSPSIIIDEEHSNSPRFDRFRGQARDKDREKGGNMDRELRTPQKRGFNKEEGEANCEPSGRTGPWTSQRGPRKSFGAEDGDRFRRGNNEMQKDRPPRYENFGRDRDRMNNIRTKRDDSSWILDDNRDRDRGGDREKGDPYRADRDGEQRGSRDFRNFNRDRDHRSGRDDDRNQRVEKDPEWLDASPEESEGKGQAHSMEEFQRWKARMKASEEKKPKTPVEENLSFERERPSPTPPLTKEEKPGPVAEVPLSSPVTENGVDRFFTLWNPPSSAKSPDSIPDSQARPPAVGRSSKFSSFFVSTEQPSPRQPTPQQPTPQFQPITQEQRQPTPSTNPDNSTSEDKEGFRRILQMLGGTGRPGGGGLSLGGSQTPPIQSPLPAMQFKSSSSPGIPSPHHSQHPQPPQQHHQLQQQQQQSHQPHPPQQQQQQHHQHQQQHLGHPPYTPIQPSPSPLQNLQMPSRDANADFLLGLMRQGNPTPQGPPLPSLNNHSYGGPSQMPPPPQISTSPQAFQRPPKNLPTSSMFEDPAITGFQRRPNQEPVSILQQRVPPPQMEQHQLPSWLSQGPQGPPHGPQGPQGLHGLSAQQQQGLHGPGGPHPSQGGPQQLLRGQQVAPPPGFNRNGGMLPHGSLPPAQHGPPPPFMGGNIPQFQMNGMPPNFPQGPGGPPPPPFFGINGPPPPPYSMPFHHDPMMGLPPHFGFPHEPLKNSQHHGGPGKPTKF